MIYRSWFSPSTTWDLGIELRLSRLGSMGLLSHLDSPATLDFKGVLGIGTQYIRLGGKYFYPLSHFSNPFCSLRLSQNVALVGFELVMYTRLTLNLQ